METVALTPPVSRVVCLVLLFLLAPAPEPAGATSSGPELRFLRSANTMLLIWPQSAIGFELQVAEELSGPDRWQKPPEPARAIGTNWVVFISANTAQRFFRLARPTMHHVLVVGQSLAIGAHAQEILSPTQPFRNKMFVGQSLDGGRPDLPPDDLSDLVPLHESWQENQLAGETIASGFANWISSQVGEEAPHDLLVSNCARGNSDYALLRRVPSGAPEEEPTGTYPYLRGLAQVEAAYALIGVPGYRFEAILSVHGEGDSINPGYDQNIREWQRDYEADIHRLTGQANRIPMFHTQISAWGNLGNANNTLSPFKLLAEYERDPERTVLVGPKYHLPYRPEDGLHLTSQGYRWLGEYYAKAYYRHILLGQPWSPLRPTPGGITRSNHVIDIRLTGAVGDLVLDTNLVSNPAGWILDPNASPALGPALIQIGPYGFEYWDTDGSEDPWKCSTFITNVTVVPPDRVRIFLNQAPLGAGRRIQYGFTALPRSEGGSGGPLAGPRGCLRDSDPAPSRHGHTLYNWCVHFDLSCP